MPPRRPAESSRKASWRNRIRGFFRSLLSDLVTTVFPADCRLCEGPLTLGGLTPVCDTCLERLTPQTVPGCWRCGAAIDLELDLESLRYATQMLPNLRCRECSLAEPAFDQAISYGVYRDGLRDCIQLLKFEGIAGLSRPLGDRLAETMLGLEPIPMLVIAVPLFAARQRQRGYNQSVLLADRALRRVKTVRPEWKLTTAHTSLKRVRNTEAQFTLNQRERRQNLRGAFKAAQDFTDKDVMLVDDILTSGATARECAHTLRAAGAVRIFVVTLARAQKRDLLQSLKEPQDEFTRWDSTGATPLTPSLHTTEHL